MAVQHAGSPEALLTFTLQVSFDTSAKRGKMLPPESKQSLSAGGLCSPEAQLEEVGGEVRSNVKGAHSCAMAACDSTAQPCSVFLC